jgi:hypothetical protein
MPVACPNADLELLQVDAQSAAWLVLVAPLPLVTKTALLEAAAAGKRPMLLIDSQLEAEADLAAQLALEAPPTLLICSDLLAAEAGEQTWYLYNDRRRNGTVPPDALVPHWPNLRLEGHKLRPTRRLDAVLSTWLEHVAADNSQPGLLWLPATQAPQVLAGAGVFLERLATIWLEGEVANEGLDAELVDRLEASCHRLESDGPKHQVWRLDGQRLVERELLLVTQQREALQVRCGELEVQLSAQTVQIAEQSQQREVLQVSVEELEAQLSALVAQATEHTQLREELQERVAELEGQLGAQTAQTAEQSQRREVLQERVGELEIQLSALVAQAAEQRQQREKLLARQLAGEVQPPRRMLLMLGMHRSGTSALAGLLCQQGFQPPQNLDVGDAGNPTGYWEPQIIRAFHNKLLEAAQSSWEDPLLPVLPWQPLKLEEALEELEQALVADFPTIDPHAVQLIKDPRQCRLLPLWSALFEKRPFQVSVVLVLRQPEAVAASLLSRDQMPLDRALLLWLSHNLEAERATRKLPRLVLSYDDLLEDPAEVVQRCQELAGLPVTAPTAEFVGQWIRPDLNHHPSRPEQLNLNEETKTLLYWSNKVYGALLDPAAESQHELLDRAQGVLQEKLHALLEQGSRRITLQLFWEPQAGGGFSEGASQRRSVIVGRGRARVIFRLPIGSERPRLLRVDLAEEPTMVNLYGIRLRSAAGTLLWEWAAEQANPYQEQALPGRGLNPYTLVLEDGVVLAATADPGIVLNVPVNVLHQLEADAELELDALWQTLPQDVAKVVLESKRVG